VSQSASFVRAVVFSLALGAGVPAWAVPLATGQPSSSSAARRLDAASTLIVQTWKDGAAARLAHDHAIIATAFSGELHHDPAAPSQSRIVVEVDARRLVVDDDRARQRVGLEPGVPQKDRDAVTASMMGPEQLDVQQHPRIRFESTKVTPQSDGTLLVEGRFTLHGQTRTVRLPVTVEVRADGSVRGRGTLSLRVSDYGIAPYEAFFGAVKVKDEVKVHLDLIAR
jgi:polyisoprenoid-binding protein YceI